MDGRNQEGRKHVFAINESIAFLAIVHEVLQDEGYHVTIATFEPITFEQIAAAHPDAVIVDLAVGETAGWDLLERFNAEAATTAIPVLVTSTDPHLLEQAREQTERYGTHRYLEKPFDLNLMLTHIREMIGET